MEYVVIHPPFILFDVSKSSKEVGGRQLMDGSSPTTYDVCDFTYPLILY